MTSNDDQATQAATLAAEREREERFTHWLENAGGMWIAGMVALKAEPTPAPFESDEAMTSFIQDRFFDTLAQEPEVSVPVEGLHRSTIYALIGRWVSETHIKVRWQVNLVISKLHSMR